MLISFSLFQWFDIEVDLALCSPNVIVPAVGLPPTKASVAAEADPAMRVVGKSNPLSSPSGPVQGRLQSPPAKSKFLAVSNSFQSRYDETSNLRGFAYPKGLMKNLPLYLLTLVFLVSSSFGKTHHAWTLASEVFATAKPAQSDRSPKAQVAAAKAFLATLSDAEKKQALLPLNDPERQKWTNVPTKANDGGIRLGDLTRPQLEKAVAFLSTVLSENGYLMARNIMMADDLLLRNEAQAKRRGGFGSANFWIAIFGTPSETKPWGVQWDGHHVAVNLAIVGEKMTLSPAFIGTQPHKFMLGKEEIIPMENEIAWAIEFMKSLDDKQRAQAIIGTKRGRMQAGAGKDGVMPEAKGLPCKDLTKAQHALLLKLVGLWVDDLPAKPAKARMKELDTQLKKAHFAWYGPFTPESDASYHLIGPDVIVEYTGQDLGGNPLDHIHSIYRNPKNEYGAKWIKK